MASDKDYTNRTYHHGPCRVPLRTFPDVKAAAAKTADAGGADRRARVEFECRVVRVVYASGGRRFAAVQRGAAHDTFTFIRCPGMPSADSMTERDVHDAATAQRKIHRQSTNRAGMRVFPHGADIQQRLPQAGRGPPDARGQNSRRPRV